MPKDYQRITKEGWRVELQIGGAPPHFKKRWIVLAEVETKEEADQWTKSFRFRTRFRVKRLQVGGKKRGGTGGGRPKKKVT